MSDEWGIFLIPNFSPERDLHSHMERKTSPFLYIKAYLIGVNRSKITNVMNGKNSELETQALILDFELNECTPNSYPIFLGN